MPKTLEPGILYVSEEYRSAAHLCVCGCGCGEKIRTPLGPTDWKLTEESEGPTLYPSIGNWQHECQSHYFIKNGQVVWATKWTSAQIESGRKAEELRNKEYYSTINKNNSIFDKILNWLKKWFD